MIAEIVAVGTELLMGQIANTNAQYLSRRLQSLGVSVYYHTTVGDNPQRMRDTLALAFSRSDVVITTGGLGPTQDDITKEIAAQLLGLPMRFDEESWEAILARFAQLGRPCTENNRRQAMTPEGGEVLKNRCGTAPGCWVEKDGKILVQLPGPPGEMRDMFEREVFPRLAARSGGCIASRYVRIYGLGESMVGQMCADYIERTGDVTVAPYCKMGECELRVTARAQSEEAALEKIEPVVRELTALLGKSVYAVTDTDEGSVEDVVGELLVQKGLHAATAESCTGGLVAAKLISYPGISAALDEAHVTYANEAKVKYCGVREETLAAHGAVSEETAREMCEGLRKNSGADIAVATTGIAGPGGGTKEKPVGLVYVACASAYGTKVRKLQLSGTRERVRQLAAMAALHLLREAALEYEQ